MNSIKIILCYFKIVKANRKLTGLLVMSSLLTNVPYLFTSLLFSLTISALTTKNTEQVLVTMMIYFTLKIMSKGFKVMSFMIEKRLFNSIYSSLHFEMMTKLDKIDIHYFNEHHPSEVLNIINGDIKLLSNFGSWLSKAILLFISLIVSIFILSKISIGLMLFGSIVNILVITLLNIYNNKFEILDKEGRLIADDEMHFYSELLTGLKDIKIFNLVSKLWVKYEKINLTYIENHDKQLNNRIISHVINPSMTMMTEIVLMVYACVNCLNGRFGIETVLIIQSYFGTLFSSLSDFISVLRELRGNSVSMHRYEQFIKAPNSCYAKVSEKIEVEDSSICFKDVDFNYGHIPVFNKFNLHIPTDGMYAVVGRSGSGKSTLFNLLLRFEKPEAGEIQIGKRSIQDYSKKEYSSWVTCVLQNPYLFNMSIYENLAMIDHDRQHIKKACQLAGIDEYIMSLPKQYDTVLEANGNNLSGGQKQRIAIARALLKKTKIILFDEITSALDEETSLNIMKTIHQLKKDHLILMILHKPSEYEQCDNKIVLNT